MRVERQLAGIDDTMACFNFSSEEWDAIHDSAQHNLRHCVSTHER